MKNGSCKKIENSFITIYNIKNINTPTRIMRQMIGHIHSYPLNLSDIEAYINNKKINVTICNYNFCGRFENTGLIEVKVIIIIKLYNQCKNYSNILIILLK